MSDTQRERMMSRGLYPPPRNPFAANLEMICKSQGVKLNEVAARAGMIPNTLYVMKRHGNPAYNTIVKLARALDVDPGLFFDHEG